MSILNVVPAIWAEGNEGATAQIRQRLVNPNGQYPVVFGEAATVLFLMRGYDPATGVITVGVPKISYATGLAIDPSSINPATGLAYDADANDDGEGWVSYSPAATDTDAPGNYVYRWVIETAVDDKVSYPNNAWLRLDVHAEIDDPAPFPV